MLKMAQLVTENQDLHTGNLASELVLQPPHNAGEFLFTFILAPQTPFLS